MERIPRISEYWGAGSFVANSRSVLCKLRRGGKQSPVFSLSFIFIFSREIAYSVIYKKYFFWSVSMSKGWFVNSSVRFEIWSVHCNCLFRWRKFVFHIRKEAASGSYLRICQAVNFTVSILRHDGVLVFFYVWSNLNTEMVLSGVGAAAVQVSM